jgi:hypothetical protein
MGGAVSRDFHSLDGKISSKPRATGFEIHDQGSPIHQSLIGKTNFAFSIEG